MTKTTLISHHNYLNKNPVMVYLYLQYSALVIPQ